MASGDTGDFITIAPSLADKIRSLVNNSVLIYPINSLKLSISAGLKSFDAISIFM